MILEKFLLPLGVLTSNDMINDILIAFFQEKDYVIIPRKGVFIKVKDAKSNADQINFIYNPTIDYAEIIAYTKTALEVDDAAANTIIEGFCALMDSHLKNKGEYEIEGIATLRTDHKWGVYMDSNHEVIRPVAKTTVVETPPVVVAEIPVPEKRLDTLLAETPHRKIEVSAPVTFADKYIKQTDHAHNVDEVVEEVKEIIEEVVEVNCEVPSGEIKEAERRDKLNEIFASKRVQDSSADLSNKLNELYKTKKEETPPAAEPTPTPMPTPVPAPAPVEPLQNEPYVVPKKKGVDKTMLFFIISILLFLCALGYYFIVKNEVDLKLPGGQDSTAIEQIEVID